MKCPKCGYNSFEYNDSCIKCSNDLKTFKETHNLKPIVLPEHARIAMAEEFKALQQTSTQTKETADTSSDMFSFSLSDTASSKPAPIDNPFDFDDDAFTAKPAQSDDFNFGGNEPAAKPAAFESDFSNLLEQTAHAPETTQAAAAPGSNKEEFNLNDFSWDDAPTTTKSGDTKKPSDDFSSLFGEAEKK